MTSHEQSISKWQQLPELQALVQHRELIRIPIEVDVPVTPRIRRLIDSSPFRRLMKISQLGLVSLVYPAATHTRFEHSLGVYRNALLYLHHLSHDDRFRSLVSVHDAEIFIVAGLLHDIGHWPFCHPIEDMRLTGVPRHEHFAAQFLLDAEIANILRQDFDVNPQEVISLLSGQANTVAGHILKSMLSGPVDIDKMDYLFRDSLHAGVPYGNNFDRQRLIASICVNEAGNGIAISEKGKTAAEMMVFARYVMFSEVYWHHAVRSATAMFQRAFFETYSNLTLDDLFRQTEQPMSASLLESASSTSPARTLFEGVLGGHRALYKRLARYSFFEEGEVYQRLARRPYPWLIRCGQAFAQILSKRLGQTIESHEVLFDAPPVKLEVEFNVDVYFAKENQYHPIGEVSPVLKTLALRQFDDYVKRVRIFVHPRIATEVRALSKISQMVIEASETTDILSK
jgi:uncharacterized protein